MSYHKTYSVVRLRLSIHRGVRPLDSSQHSQVLDLLVVVLNLPKQGFGVLVDLDGGSIESRSQKVSVTLRKLPVSQVSYTEASK